MVKRLAIVLFCIGLMGLWSTDAKAWPASSSGWYVKVGSVIVDSSWVKIANTDAKPTLIQVTIVPTDNVIVYYQNPGGNTGGVGVPFDLPLEIFGVDTLFPTALSGHGKYTESSVEFSDNVIINRINQLYDNILYENAPNPNWVPYAIDILSMNVIIQAFADLPSSTYPCPTDIMGYNGDLFPYNDTCYVTYNSDGIVSVGNEEEVVHIEGFCELSPDGTTYECLEDKHWEWSKKDQSYPYDY